MSFSVLMVTACHGPPQVLNDSVCPEVAIRYDFFQCFNCHSHASGDWERDEGGLDELSPYKLPCLPWCSGYYAIKNGLF